MNGYIGGGKPIFTEKRTWSFLRFFGDGVLATGSLGSTRILGFERMGSVIVLVGEVFLQPSRGNRRSFSEWRCVCARSD